MWNKKSYKILILFVLLTSFLICKFAVADKKIPLSFSLYKSVKLPPAIGQEIDQNYQEALVLYQEWQYDKAKAKLNHILKILKSDPSIELWRRGVRMQPTRKSILRLIERIESGAKEAKKQRRILVKLRKEEAQAQRQEELARKKEEQRKQIAKQEQRRKQELESKREERLRKLAQERAKKQAERKAREEELVRKEEEKIRQIVDQEERRKQEERLKQLAEKKAQKQAERKAKEEELAGKRKERQREIAQQKAMHQQELKTKQEQRLKQLAQKRAQKEAERKAREEEIARQRFVKLIIAEKRRQQIQDQRAKRLEEKRARREELARQKERLLKQLAEEKAKFEKRLEAKQEERFRELEQRLKELEELITQKSQEIEAKQEAPVSKEFLAGEYFINIGDQIEVFVWQNPDVSKDVTVGPDGKISYPLVGRLKVTGLSIEQLEKRISEGLAKYIRAPQVSIMMKQYSGEKIIILGEVNYPGIYTYIGRIDLIEALAMAGDFTEDAREDSVIVVRGNLTEAPVAQRINVARILRGKTLKEQLTLVPNDVIYVPRSFIANVNKFLDNIWPTISRTRDAIGLKRDLEEEF